MELHCEGEDGYSTPHPERPDRVRAVMARLTASALAGAPLAHQGGLWDSCKPQRANHSPPHRVRPCWCVPLAHHAGRWGFLNEV